MPLPRSHNVLGAPFFVQKVKKIICPIFINFCIEWQKHFMYEVLERISGIIVDFSMIRGLKLA